MLLYQELLRINGRDCVGEMHPIYKDAKNKDLEEQLL